MRSLDCILHISFAETSDSGIGTGLFVGTGSAYATSGPAGLLLAYIIVGAVLWCVMQSIAELATVVSKCFFPSARNRHAILIAGSSPQLDLSHIGRHASSILVLDSVLLSLMVTATRSPLQQKLPHRPSLSATGPISPRPW